MNVRRRCLALVSTVLVGLLFAAPRAGAEVQRPPNVVFILIDDLGWADLGCYGSTFHETPHIDKLASPGDAFHQRLRRLPGLLADAGQHHDRQVSRPGCT